ncbi:ABC transporter permease [bacterium]|nr:ABC transporter permease [candidate division CSSED10-310 bacterium]
MNAVQFGINLMAAGITRGSPMLFAAVGEIVSERSGVLNLGLEGLMLMGAMTGYGVSYKTGDPYMGVMAGILAAGFLSLIHAFVSVALKGEQVVSGLALTFFGTGLAAVLGAPLIEMKGVAPRFGTYTVPLLGRLPVIGPIFFQQNVMVYLGYFIILAVWFVLYKTRLGLHLRACGEHPTAADAMGVHVLRYRYGSVFFGGCLAGLGGAALSLGITPGWIDGMTAGQGWIAVGLVIFAGWNPWRAALGSYLFGAIRRLPLDLQGVPGLPFFRNPNIGYFLNMLPYLFCIAVLLISSRRSFRLRLGAPAALGLPFMRGER